jgi:beta-carotene ketolase (CrtW type)
MGLALATAITAAWLFSLLALLSVDLASQSLSLVVLAIGLRTFLQTGLFIIGHDAMHGVLLPLRSGANQRLGQLALALYACLPYQHCLLNHRQHHLDPGSHQDPDVLAGAGPLAWYGRFMAGYLGVGQMASLLTTWAMCLLFAWPHTANPALAVALVCILPLILSSLQLFAFGTYLPHRGAGQAWAPGHQAHSLDLPVWLSLIACYHFGYHREHHQSPGLPWFALPAQRQSDLSACRLAPVPRGSKDSAIASLPT